MPKILNIVGARPNFMKIAPLQQEFKKHSDTFEVKLLHTGQHYDYEMSEVFFEELGIREPDIYLGIGGGTHAEQTGKLMMAFEQVLDEEEPELIIVVGDVNATLACSLTAVKKGVKVAHIEAGLRSYDRTMPEEINRIITDSISDLLFTPSEDGNANLKKEGIPEEKIHFVGNIMIDTLFRMRDIARTRSTIHDELGLNGGAYGLITLHRPSNVDVEETYRGIMHAFGEITGNLPLIWPVHPRSRKQAEAFGIWEELNRMEGLILTEPIGYLDMVALMEQSSLVLTDSGGVQEETTALGVPCLTLRKNTERPITVHEGTNRVVGIQPERIVEEAVDILKNGTSATENRPLYWDGKTSERILQILVEYV